MEITFSKLVALGIAIVYLIAVGVSGAPTDGLLKFAGFLLFVLALIWFPDELGDLTGIKSGTVNRASPGWMVAAGGWFLLVGLPLSLFLLDYFNVFDPKSG